MGGDLVRASRRNVKSTTEPLYTKMVVVAEAAEPATMSASREALVSRSRFMFSPQLN